MLDVFAILFGVAGAADQLFDLPSDKLSRKDQMVRIWDPLTGKIQWPFALMPPQFENYRKHLDELFEERARHGGQVSFRTFEQIRQTSNDFLEALRKDIKNMPPQDYLAGKRFVNALAHQAEQG